MAKKNRKVEPYPYKVNVFMVGCSTVYDKDGELCTGLDDIKENGYEIKLSTRLVNRNEGGFNKIEEFYKSDAVDVGTLPIPLLLPRNPPQDTTLIKDLKYRLFVASNKEYQFDELVVSAGLDGKDLISTVTNSTNNSAVLDGSTINVLDIPNGYGFVGVFREDRTGGDTFSYINMTNDGFIDVDYDSIVKENSGTIKYIGEIFACDMHLEKDEVTFYPPTKLSIETMIPEKYRNPNQPFRLVSKLENDYIIEILGDYKDEDLVRHKYREFIDTVITHCDIGIKKITFTNNGDIHGDVLLKETLSNKIHGRFDEVFYIDPHIIPHFDKEFTLDTLHMESGYAMVSTLSMIKIKNLFIQNSILFFSYNVKFFDWTIGESMSISNSELNGENEDFVLSISVDSKKGERNYFDNTKITAKRLLYIATNASVVVFNKISPVISDSIAIGNANVSIVDSIINDTSFIFDDVQEATAVNCKFGNKVIRYLDDAEIFKVISGRISISMTSCEVFHRTICDPEQNVVTLDVVECGIDGTILKDERKLFSYTASNTTMIVDRLSTINAMGIDITNGDIRTEKDGVLNFIFDKKLNIINANIELDTLNIQGIEGEMSSLNIHNNQITIENELTISKLTFAILERVTLAPQNKFSIKNVRHLDLSNCVIYEDDGIRNVEEPIRIMNIEELSMSKNTWNAYDGEKAILYFENVKTVHMAELLVRDTAKFSLGLVGCTTEWDLKDMRRANRSLVTTAPDRANRELEIELWLDKADSTSENNFYVNGSIVLVPFLATSDRTRVVVDEPQVSKHDIETQLDPFSIKGYEKISPLGDKDEH